MFRCIKKSVVVILGTLLSSLVMGAYANTNTVIQQQIAREHRIEKTHTSAVAHLRAQSRHVAARYSAWVQRNVMAKQRRGHPTDNSIPQAMVFVSLGMPKALLVRTLQQAQAFHLPVVIRGLKAHSFRKTVAMIFDLNKNAGHKKIGGVLIDPVWFRQFHIRVVPAVVVSHSSRACDSQQTCSALSFDVVRGNISVQRALEIMAQQGQAAPDVAKALLRKYAHA